MKNFKDLNQRCGVWQYNITISEVTKYSRLILNVKSSKRSIRCWILHNHMQYKNIVIYSTLRKAHEKCRPAIRNREMPWRYITLEPGSDYLLNSFDLSILNVWNNILAHRFNKTWTLNCSPIRILLAVGVTQGLVRQQYENFDNIVHKNRRSCIADMTMATIK